MQVHGYIEPEEFVGIRTIRATIDGHEWGVPDVPANRLRKMIAEWEAEGNTIPAYKAPPEPVPSLTKRQVVGALIEADVTYEPDADIRAAIGLVEDSKDRARALNDWENVLTAYQRSHPLFNDPVMLSAMGLSSAQVDQLWALGATLPQ